MTAARGPDGGRRADAERSREAILAAAVGLLREGADVDMRRLAGAAQVSRSTLYRHFASADAVRAGLRAAGLAAARRDVAEALRGERPALAQLRRVVAGLVRTGAGHAFARTSPVASAAAGSGGDGDGDGPVDGSAEDELGGLAADLQGLTERLTALAGLAPAPPPAWLRIAVAHAVETCLHAALSGDDVAAAAERIFGTLTAPLDQGLAVLDPAGRLLAVNAEAVEALALDRPPAGQAVLAPAVPTTYDDGSRCPADAYPIARAVRDGEAQDAVRGHETGGDAPRWYAVRVEPLRRAAAASAYGIVATFTDVTVEHDAALRRLRPAGSLGRREPVTLDVARVLDAVPAQLLPDQVVAEARRLVGVPVALYVVDIDGTHLLRLAGPEEFPERLQAPLALGPELAEDGMPELEARLARELAGVVMAPLWLRARAVGVLLAAGGRRDVLAEVARQAAPAIELANGYTDVFDAVRRRKDMNPAGEIQQSLLPPRIARLSGGQLAGGVLPSYDTGGDWFDYVENRDGAWVAVADAAGRGARAAALGSVALAALRASRRNEATLEEAVGAMHETMCDAGDDEFFLTALVARWSPVYASFSWINAGHPPPLVLAPDGTVTELRAPPALPLGLGPRERPFKRSFRTLHEGERVVLYTDGVSNRPVGDGVFGSEGIARAARSADGGSASALARAIQEEVVAASERPLRDDAAVVVLAPGDG
jgi:PAS domain-containing protein